MASYHCHVSVGKKGRAASHAQYVVRAGDYAPDLAGKRYEDLEAFGHANMPVWAQANPIDFWEASDKYERANGSTYREFEVALPRELTPPQRKELVDDFVERALGAKHVYSYGIHCPRAKLEGGEQPHAHIMYSERLLDGIERAPDEFFKRYNAKSPAKGGARKDSAGTAERLVALRELWADVTNEHLKKHGHAARVDHRSNLVRGIEDAPEQHLGWRATDEQRAAVIELRAAKAALKVVLQEADKHIAQIEAHELQEQRAQEQIEQHFAREKEAEAGWAEEEERQQQEAEKYLADLQRLEEEEVAEQQAAAQELAAEQRRAQERNPLGLPEEALAHVEQGLMSYAGGRYKQEGAELKKKLFAWLERDWDAAINWCLQWSLDGWAEGDIPEPEEPPQTQAVSPSREKPKQAQPAPQRRRDDDDYSPGFER